jgi:opacity protein-like surface antigen
MTKMRAIFLLLIGVMFGQTAIAQDGAVAPQSRKKFKIGFKLSPSVDWFGVDTKNVKLDAAKVKFGYGITTEFAFGNNYALTVGVEHKLSGASLKFDQFPRYTTEESDTLFLNLSQRNYKLDYVVLPLTLKLMTNEIGYFTYFGQFGIDASFLVRARANDQGTYSTDPNASVEIDNRDIFREISIFKVGLNVGVGAEWNFSGNTALVMGFSYHHGFIDVMRDATQKGVSEDHMLETVDASNVRIPFALKAQGQHVSLDVGILF